MMQVLQVMNNLNMASAHVVGHSYGGATAMRSVQLSPKRVRSLILIEPIYMPLLRDAAEGELFETCRGFAESFINKANARQSETAWRTFLDTRNGSGFWDRMDDAARTRFLRNTELRVSPVFNPFYRIQQRPLTVTVSRYRRLRFMAKIRMRRNAG